MNKNSPPSFLGGLFLFIMNMTIQTADGVQKLVAEVESGDNESDAQFVKGAFISYKTLSNGHIDTVTALTASGTDAGAGAILGVDGKNITVKGSSVMDANKLTDDSVVIYIDSKNYTEISSPASIQQATEDVTAGTYFYNAFVVESSVTAGDVEVLFVDVNNKLYNASGSLMGTTDTRAKITAFDANLTSSDASYISGDLAYTVTTADGAVVANTTAIKPGTQVTVTIKANASGTTVSSDGVVVTVTGATTLGTATIAADTYTANEVLAVITFNMPSTTISELDITAANA